MEPVADQRSHQSPKRSIWNDTISGNFRGMDRAPNSEPSRTDLHRFKIDVWYLYTKCLLIREN